jgi:hypothetical protein
MNKAHQAEQKRKMAQVEAAFSCSNNDRGVKMHDRRAELHFMVQFVTTIIFIVGVHCVVCGG